AHQSARDRSHHGGDRRREPDGVAHVLWWSGRSHAAARTRAPVPARGRGRKKPTASRRVGSASILTSPWRDAVCPREWYSSACLGQGGDPRRLPPAQRDEARNGVTPPRTRCWLL